MDRSIERDVRFASTAAAAKQLTTARSIAVGNVVFVSGCTGAGGGMPAPAAVEDQVELALARTRSALESVGSGIGNVVKTFFLLTDLDHYGRVRKAETEFYERHAPQLVTTPPAATLMVVPALERPDLLVQYEAIAALDRSAPEAAVTYFPEFWAGRELAYPHVPKEHAKFARSQAIGNLLIVSGCQALDHDTVRVETDDVADQSRIVLDKVRVAVEETGGSLANLVKTNVFVKDATALATYREVEQAFYEEQGVASDRPAGSVFVVTELPRPEFLIEVEAFAVADADRPGWNVERRPGTAVAAESASAGGLVFVSACDAGGTSGPIEHEITAALDELSRVLARAGSSLESVAKTTLALTDAANHAQLQDTLAAYCSEHAPNLVERPPASTFTTVAAIPGGARFQVDAVASL